MAGEPAAVRLAAVRAEMLDQDLEVSSNPDNLAHILQDNMHNTYLGSDVRRAFSQLTPQDSLW